MTRAGQKKKHGAAAGGAPSIPWLERVMGMLGLVFVLGGIGVLLYDAFRDGPAAPEVMVEVERILEQGNGFLVVIRAINQGDRTAAQVVVRGALTRDGQVIETSETTFDYLPDGSESGGGLFFAEDPRQNSLDVRALGYTEP